MRSRRSRRKFIQTGASLLGLSITIPAAARAQGSKTDTGINEQLSTGSTMMRGRLLDADENPVQLGRVISPDTASYFIDINEDGEFEAEVLQDARYTLGYSKKEGNDTIPVENGVPHLFYMGKYRADSDPTDLGDIQLPRAFLVDVLVTDWDGKPVTDAQVQFKHINNKSSFGSRDFTTNEDGLVKIDGADFTGYELAEDCKIIVQPPDEERFTEKEYTETIFVDEPITREFVLEDKNSETTEEPTPTEENTSTPTQATTTTTTTSTPTQSGTTNTEQATDTPTESDTRTRGFFSNSQGSSAGLLEDPFVLTVGGFVLSAAGILVQLVRGR